MPLLDAMHALFPPDGAHGFETLMSFVFVQSCYLLSAFLYHLFFTPKMNFLFKQQYFSFRSAGMSLFFESCKDNLSDRLLSDTSHSQTLASHCSFIANANPCMPDPSCLIRAILELVMS